MGDIDVKTALVGFIGSGKMGQAIIHGFLDSGVLSKDRIFASASSPSSASLAATKSLGVNTAHSNKEIARQCSVIVIAVKPYLVGQVLDEIAGEVTRNKLVISVAAGVFLADIEAKLPTESRVARVMPNTASQVREGASVFSVGQSVLPSDSEVVDQLISTLGYCRQVKESLIEPVSGLSGSGVAYMFVALEALADGGVKVGIPRAMAYELAAQTMLGAAKMAKVSGRHPGQLKDDVCSPGGSTIAAIHKLEAGGYRAALIDAVETAATRAAQLGKK